MHQVPVKPAIDKKLSATRSKQCEIKMFVLCRKVESIIVFRNTAAEINPVVSIIDHTIGSSIGTTDIFILYISRTYIRLLKCMCCYFGLGLEDPFVYITVVSSDLATNFCF